MSPAQSVWNAIRRVGEQVKLLRGENVSAYFYASLQPDFPCADASGPAGWGAPARYRLYAPADAPLLCEGDEISCRERRYHVAQAGSVYLSGGILYQQAVLVEGGGA